MVIVSKINSSLPAKIWITRFQRYVGLIVDSTVSLHLNDPSFDIRPLPTFSVLPFECSVYRSGQCHGSKNIFIDFNQGGCSAGIQHTSDPGTHWVHIHAIRYSIFTSEQYTNSLDCSQLIGGSGAPSNCLQYYTEPEGWMQTFNYDDTSQFVDERIPSYFVSCGTWHLEMSRSLIRSNQGHTTHSMKLTQPFIRNAKQNCEWFSVEEKIESNVLIYFSPIFLSVAVDSRTVKTDVVVENIPDSVNHCDVVNFYLRMIVFVFRFRIIWIMRFASINSGTHAPSHTRMRSMRPNMIFSW